MAKKQRNLLIAFLLVTVLAVATSFVSGNRPQLGLDLKGGVSVVLKPTSPTTNETLDQAIEIIRNRIDSLGVVEPEISRQGGNILVQIPGVKDRDRAIALVGSTAELRFRPVLKDSCSVNPGAIGNCVPDEGATLESLGLDPNATTTSAAPEATTTSSASTTTADPNASSSTTTPASTTTVAKTPEERRKELEDLAGISLVTTTREDDLAESTVILPERDRKSGELKVRYQLGPTGLTGLGISKAEAQAPQIAGSSGGWTVALDPKDGAEGRDKLNALAAACYSSTEQCPTGKLAIVLDGVVQFAGTVQAANFPDTVSLSGNYSKREAQDIATALKYGSLPIELEQQSVQTVSATLGKDALRAGLIAGAIGVFLVSAYAIAYYRLLGLVALVNLLLAFGLLWAVIVWLGETRGLTLTLAGITGIIVSFGVAMDSNVVYFEHMKEDVRAGRTPRAAAERSFAGAFSTVLKADLASLIGAVTLFLLTSGQVRGFALYLGIATLLDLLSTYFFLGPAVTLLGRTKHYAAHPTAYGLPDGPRDTPAMVPAVGGAR